MSYIIDAAIVAIPVGIITFAISKKRNIETLKAIGISLFSMYMVSVLILTLVVGPRNLGRRISLKPFAEIAKKGFSSRRLIKQLIENTLLFVPFGVFLQLNKKPFKKTVFLGFLLSVTIELIQYCSARGVCDIDDCIANVIGTIAGYIVAKIVIIKYKSRS